MKKKAEDLKPGDVVNFGIGPHVILRVNSIGTTLEGETYLDAATVALEVPMACIAPATLIGSYQVESPTLSPAQQHAEELLQRLREAVDSASPEFGMFPSWFRPAEALLARIDPPKPPSVEEAVDLIQMMIQSDPSNGGLGLGVKYNGKSARDMAESFIERARAAGTPEGGAQ